MPFPGEIQDALDRAEQQTLWNQQQAAINAGTPLTLQQYSADEAMDKSAEATSMAAINAAKASTGDQS